jgi:mono/diheme cytochrome c family protein
MSAVRGWRVRAGTLAGGPTLDRGTCMKYPLLGASLSLAALLGCAPEPAAEAPDRLAPLRAFEAERRAATDFASLAPSDAAFGADPYRVVALPAAAAPARWASLLRGRDAIVLLDDALTELDRAAAPVSPSGLAVAPDGTLLAVGEGSAAAMRYRVEAGALRPEPPLNLGDARAPRDVAVGPEGVVYVVDERTDRLLVFPRPGSAGGEARPSPARRELRVDDARRELRVDDARRELRVDDARRELRVDAGPLRVARAGGWLVVDCLLGHSVLAWPVDSDGLPIASGLQRVLRDGPSWGFAAVAVDDGVLVAAGGVEDHPLDRRGGSFGWVDSAVFLDHIGPGGARTLATIDVSSHGVVTPKALHLARTGEGLRLWATGYGGEAAVEIEWAAAPLTGAALPPPRVTAVSLPPGTAHLAGDGPFLAANTLLDGWVHFGDGATRVAHARDLGAAPRDRDVQLGEALFFTTRMAPWNSSEAELSRFTCETCHFEGYVDGRTHHTGRGEVRATTKPLLGLFNNRPHFSRALDPDLTAVADNEFRVAGARSGHDPWFSLDERQLPWLADLYGGAAPETLVERSPLDLRRALMRFLMDFTHRRNPAAAGRSRFDARERAGAELFAQRCARCHAARLSADEPAGEQPVDRWEAMVFSPAAPIVWGRAGYEKTGIEPYVHRDGARVPSLRRVYKKRPYFTDGRVDSLPGVLDAVRWSGEGGFSHAGGEGAAPSEEERAALLAFLELL